MGEELPKGKKTRLLKRRGKEIEEALLFQDHMDEAALEEWERKMGLKEKPKVQRENTPPSRNAAQIEEARPQGTPPQGLSPQPSSKGPEPVWKQAGRLRWLGISNVRSYWEEQTPRRKGFLLVLLASGILATWGMGLFVHGLFFHEDHGVERVTVSIPYRDIVVELIVPINGGRHGLLLGVAIEVEDDSLRPWMLRRAIYDLLSPLGPSQLKGPSGMETVRKILEEGLTEIWPGVRPGRVRFVDYLLF